MLIFVEIVYVHCFELYFKFKGTYFEFKMSYVIYMMLVLHCKKNRISLYNLAQTKHSHQRLRMKLPIGAFGLATFQDHYLPRECRVHCCIGLIHTHILQHVGATSQGRAVRLEVVQLYC